MAAPKLNPNLNLGDFDLGDVNGIDLSAILDNKPSPVVQGDDGNMYYSNAYYTPSGWQTEPDFSTPVYYFNQPSELGDVRKIYFDVEDDGSVTTQGSWQTEETIKSFWDADEGMGYFKEANPDLTYDNWMSFVKESSALNAQGLNQYDNSEEYKALSESYGIVEGFQNDDGDLFRWNGTGFTKTYKTPQVDYAKEIIQSAVLAAATWGTANAAIGTSLKSFFVSQLSMSGAAASAATSSLVSAGIQGVLGEELTVEGVLGSAIGAGLGTQFSQLGIFSDLSAASTAAIASASASAIEQGIVNGTVDLETVLTSGALGGGLEIGKDLLSSLSGNQAFTFGGLIEEGSSTYEFFNGTPDPLTGQYSGGVIADIRGGFNEFVEQNITGGDWWESATESYDYVDNFENKDGKFVTLTGYDGLSETISWKDFVAKGLDEVRGTSPYWEILSSTLDSVDPDDGWIKTLSDWINNAASGSGSHTTEGGTTVTVATTGPGGNNGGSGADFDCSTVSRVQTPDATEEESCGPCVEGFQSDEFGKCIPADTVGVCPEGQVYNEVAGACVDEVFFTPGQPCNTSDGQQGIFDDEGGCYVPTIGTGGNGGNGGNGECGEGEQYNEETQKCETVTGGPPGGGPESCGGNKVRDAQGNCVDPIETLCSQPRPTEYGFAQINWDKLCSETPVTSGTGGPPPPTNGCPEGQTKDEQGNCVTTTVTPPPPNGCPEGYTKDEQGNCVVTTVTPPPPPGSPCAQQNKVENEDGSCGPCLQGYMIDPKGFDQCVPTGIPVTTQSPAGGGGGGGGSGGGRIAGGGTGMFEPANVSMGYNRTPELVVTNKPYKDYAAELDEQVKRLLTQRNKDIV
ncbi:MAG: hypothetical protein P8J32_07060 [bacterium]|nr:hypothetical protein [bacterium]